MFTQRIKTTSNVAAAEPMGSVTGPKQADAHGADGARSEGRSADSLGSRRTTPSHLAARTEPAIIIDMIPGSRTPDATTSVTRLGNTDVAVPEVTVDTRRPEVRRDDELRGLDFRRLYESYKHKVYGTIHHVIGPSDEVDDIVQSVFLEIHRSLPRYQGQSKLSTWIYRIAVNVALQHIRKKRRRRVFLFFSPPDPERDCDSATDTRPGHEQRDLLRKIHGLLDHVSEKKRIVFILHELDGREIDEIADLLDIPLNTVRSRLHAARVELTDRMRRASLVDPDLRGGEVKS
ncbi:MAG: RNA polymerase sigma factor [Myxococcales bacterium]|nr:RNA polymerase sigma factor [Myxococcales bacterium]